MWFVCVVRLCCSVVLFGCVVRLCCSVVLLVCVVVVVVSDAIKEIRIPLSTKHHGLIGMYTGQPGVSLTG